MDWMEFVKVYNLNVSDVIVKKTVSRRDIIDAMLKEGEIVFKGKQGNFMMLEISSKNLDVARDLVVNQLEDMRETMEK